ncbi:MAG: ribbon-helix-helix protein, CopG family [Deltaproteobacteria bacterium]|nr:ribbon-helix-helix protein, CopG family [Deltaproteobacteria bacterium]
MSRMMEPAEFSVPPALARRVEKLARQERRTPAALLREMLRLYERYRKQQEAEEDPYTEAWVMNLVREVEEEDRLHPKTQAELDREDEELRRYGAAQAKKLGIKSDRDVDRLVQEYRKERRDAGRS